MSSRRVSRSRVRPARVAGCTGLSVSALLLAGWLATHHPLSPLFAWAGVLGVAVWAAWRPLWIPLALMALLPVAGLAPWTGWMLAEEFDLLLLALLAGGWARLAWPAGLPPRQPATDGAGRVWWLLVTVYVGLTAVSTWRGLHDAGAWTGGAFTWGWWQGWREPMNVLRTVKPLAWALLAWPLWQALQARAPEAAARAVGLGAAAGLAVVAAVATWERLAWPGLANFSTDYRTTALFWETHIGGAALDGFLALTLPFGLWAAAAARSRRTWLAAVAVLCLAGYAVLTTFSRGLYMGVAAGALLWWLMTPRPRDGQGPGVVVPLGWVLLFVAAAALAFPGSGWRGLGALFGLMLLLFWRWQQGVAPVPARRVLGAAAAGAAGGALAVTAALALPGALKAPYLLYAACGVACAWAWTDLGARPAQAWRVLAGWAAWAAAAVAALGVALHWGESASRWAMVVSVGLLAVAAAGGAALPRWRGAVGGRWRLATLGAMAVSAMVVGSFAGGSYLEGRLAAAGDDWQGRLHHWSRSLSLAQGDAATVWGLGPGRFAAHFALSGETTDQVGDYRWQPAADGGGTLVLTAGKHMLGFGELFRMSQRIAVPEGDLLVRWRAAVTAPVQLHVEVCSKHLLYEGTCRTAGTPIVVATGESTSGWQEGRATLPARSDWRQPVFSVALDTRGGWMRLDEISLTDSLGRELLHNGGFDDGLARWLPSSDRHHLPWHAKNLGLHLRVEQGWLGLAGFAVLLAFAVARLTLGRARHHPLAAPLLAGIVGFLIVGAFDSLLDIPRLAFAFLWLLGVAATLRAPVFSPPAAAAARPPDRGPAPAR